MDGNFTRNNEVSLGTAVVVSSRSCRPVVPQSIVVVVLIVNDLAILFSAKQRSARVAGERRLIPPATAAPPSSCVQRRLVQWQRRGATAQTVGATRDRGSNDSGCCGD